jgi:hypothetical protein
MSGDRASSHDSTLVLIRTWSAAAGRRPQQATTIPSATTREVTYVSRNQHRERAAGLRGVCRGEVATAMANLSDDIEWIVSGESAVNGTYRGQAQVGALWAAIAGKSFKTSPIDSSPTTTSSSCSATQRRRRVGRAGRGTHLRDGKVVQFRSRSDTAEGTFLRAQIALESVCPRVASRTMMCATDLPHGLQVRPCGREPAGPPTASTPSARPQSGAPCGPGGWYREPPPTGRGVVPQSCLRARSPARCR